MSIEVTDYANGASFQGKKLFVTSTGVVTNLNAAFLQDKVPSNFLQLGNEFGIKQTKNQGRNTIKMNEIDASMASSAVSLENCDVNINSGSQIKIGNLLIRSSSDGFGILVGTV